MFEPRIILVRPSHPGNIGAAARAMKVMGLSSLYLVSPKKFPDPEAAALSAGAQDVLEKAIVVNDLLNALDTITYVYACSANLRTEDLPLFHPGDAALNILAQSMHRTAILFGPENYGLSHEDLRYAHALIQIPANAKYHSLNLAAAVQIIVYEYHQALIEKENAASVPEMESFYQHLERIMIQTDFLNPARPRRLMPKLRRLFNRAQPDQTELNILQGILKSVTSRLSRNSLV
jgi:TrmH family RNA methyltransferase